MDIIHLKNIRIKTKIGVWEWEKAISQTISLDIQFALDTAKSSQSDNLSDTKDYSQIVAQTEAYIQNSNLKLIESLAVHLTEKIMQEFSLCWMKLKISKIGIISNVAEIGITIERGKI